MPHFMVVVHDCAYGDDFVWGYEGPSAQDAVAYAKAETLELLNESNYDEPYNPNDLYASHVMWANEPIRYLERNDL